MQGLSTKLPIEVDFVEKSVTTPKGTFNTLDRVVEATGEAPLASVGNGVGTNAVGYQAKAPYQKKEYTPRDDNKVTKKDIAISLSVGLKAAVELINGGKAELANIETLSKQLANITLAPYGVTTDGVTKE